MYEVFKIELFKKIETKLLDQKESQELSNLIEELKKGHIIGKPLSYEFFREKRIRGKRIYFLIYEEIRMILLVGVSTKKDQQATINIIKSLLPDYKRYAHTLRAKL